MIIKFKSKRWLEGYMLALRWLTDKKDYKGHTVLVFISNNRCCSVVKSGVIYELVTVFYDICYLVVEQVVIDAIDNDKLEFLEFLCRVSGEWRYIGGELDLHGYLSGGVKMSINEVYELMNSDRVKEDLIADECLEARQFKKILNLMKELPETTQKPSGGVKVKIFKDYVDFFIDANTECEREMDALFKGRSLSRRLDVEDLQEWARVMRKYLKEVL